MSSVTRRRLRRSSRRNVRAFLCSTAALNMRKPGLELGDPRSGLSDEDLVSRARPDCTLHPSFPRAWGNRFKVARQDAAASRLQESRIHAAVDASRDRRAGGTAHDQLGRLNIIAALLVANRGGDLFRHLIGRATIGRAEAVGR